MSISLKQDMYKYAGSWPRYIILHHTEDLKPNDADILFDKPTFQINKLAKTIYELDRMYLPYNFIIEKVGDDYHPIVSAPLLTKAPFLDIEDEHQEGVHIAVMGNMNADQPDRKLYNVMAIRVIIPMMKAFKISEKNIVTHSEISFFKGNSCPGAYFNMALLKSMVNNNMRQRSVTRR